VSSPDDTKTYPQIVRDRISAGKSWEYISSVIEGTETKPDKTRLDTCWRAINKVVGDRKAVEISADPTAPPVFNMYVDPKRD
jgi:hypothetical protein